MPISNRQQRQVIDEREMANLNHQQTAQINLLPQEQLPTVSQPNIVALDQPNFDEAFADSYDLLQKDGFDVSGDNNIDTAHMDQSHDWISASRQHFGESPKYYIENNRSDVHLDEMCFVEFVYKEANKFKWIIGQYTGLGDKPGFARVNAQSGEKKMRSRQVEQKLLFPIKRLRCQTCAVEFTKFTDFEDHWMTDEGCIRRRL